MIAALLLLALQAPALAPGDSPPAEWVRGEWTTIFEDETFAVGLDESATRRDGDRVKLRLRALLAPDFRPGVRFGLSELEIDCRRRTVKGLSTSEYGPSGAAIAADSASPVLPEEPWGEGDPTAQAFAAACHRTDPAGDEGEGEE